MKILKTAIIFTLGVPIGSAIYRSLLKGIDFEPLV